MLQQTSHVAKIKRILQRKAGAGEWGSRRSVLWDLGRASADRRLLESSHWCTFWSGSRRSKQPSQAAWHCLNFEQPIHPSPPPPSPPRPWKTRWIMICCTLRLRLCEFGPNSCWIYNSDETCWCAQANCRNLVKVNLRLTELQDSNWFWYKNRRSLWKTHTRKFVRPRFRHSPSPFFI